MQGIFSHRAPQAPPMPPNSRRPAAPAQSTIVHNFTPEKTLSLIGFSRLKRVNLPPIHTTSKRMIIISFNKYGR